MNEIFVIVENVFSGESGDGYETEEALVSSLGYFTDESYVEIVVDDLNVKYQEKMRENELDENYSRWQEDRFSFKTMKPAKSESKE